MIRIFPLITDATISQNIIPGICKVLERYLIIYKMDDLISMGSPSQMIASKGKVYVAGSLKKVLPGGFMESDQLLNEKDDTKDYFDSDEFKKLSSAEKQEKYDEARNKRDQQKAEREEEKWKSEKNKPPKMDISTTEIRSNLSLEPTWFKYEGPYGMQLIGVKVIPVPITNPQAFINQLMDDKGLKTFDRIVLSMGNTLVRSFRSLMRGMLRRPLRAIGVTFPEIKGDPFDDIILGKSKFGQNTMLLLNYANIKNDEIFMDSGGLDKLFALGWSSIMVADEVAKKVIFCMKEFYGHCSFVPYSFIYQAIGSEAMRAYQDLESAKKSMSPFYQQKADASKFFGESLAAEHLEKYVGLNLPCLKGDCK